ncbi:hypothetical protein SBDP1_590011 [Syntrophobacter sp. SbD1]|nr:hypothetical protein SBDP1_590011 [Syntrophobacter sp. SbD1]
MVNSLLEDWSRDLADLLMETRLAISKGTRARLTPNNTSLVFKVIFLIYSIPFEISHLEKPALELYR